MYSLTYIISRLSYEDSQYNRDSCSFVSLCICEELTLERKRSENELNYKYMVVQANENNILFYKTSCTIIHMEYIHLLGESAFGYRIGST